MDRSEKLREAIEVCGSAGAKVLSGKIEASEYIQASDVEMEALQYRQALLEVFDVMKQASPGDIEGAGYPANIQNTLLMDMHLIEDTVTSELDQLSLLNTVVTYIACNAEGMREHSMEYMDRVTDLRKALEKLYDAEAIRFCGSDGC